MAKVHRNGDVIIRVSDIVAAHIPNGAPSRVEVCTRYSRSFTFNCKSEEDAKAYINELEAIMMNE